MPREAKTADVMEQEVGLQESLQSPVKPVVDAKVVYLGSNPRFSLSKKGRLIVEKIGGKTLRQPTGAGREHYDFSVRGEDGEPVPATPVRGFMPATHPIAEVRGKPFVVCSHIDHLYEFSQQKEDEQDPHSAPIFKIVAAPEAMRIVSDYVAARLRAKRNTTRLYEAVAAS